MAFQIDIGMAVWCHCNCDYAIEECLESTARGALSATVDALNERKNGLGQP